MMQKAFKKLPQFLSKKEVDSFLKPIRRDRHRLAFTLMAYSGLRVSEVCRLKLCDLNLARGFIKIQGKGGKERIVPLTSRVQNLIEEYLRNKGKSLLPESELIGGQRSSWHSMCKKYAVRALSRKDIHCHTLRHSFATNLYEEGVQIERISQLLGHAKLDTTMIYAHISIEQKRNAVMVLDNSRFSLIRKITTITRTVTELTVKPWQDRAQSTGIVGRSSEQTQLSDYISRNISVLLLGAKGLGKSVMLQTITSDPAPIFIEEYKKKQTLIKIILTTQNIDDPDIYKDAEREMKKLSMDELLAQISDLKRVVVIDDITDLPRADKKIIAKLSTQTTLLSSSSRMSDRKLFPTYMEIKPLKRYHTRIILSEMIQMNDMAKKEQVVDDILHTAGDNLKEAEYIARQIQLGKNTEEITTEERAANQVSIAPILTLVILFFAAWVLKSYAAGMVAFSYAVLVVFRMVFYRYIFTPAIKRK